MGAWAPRTVGRGVLTAPRPGGLGTARPALRFMESEHLQRLDVRWDHEPGRRLESGTGFQPVSHELLSIASFIFNELRVR
ncbi:MAG: hypothetical protein DME18_09790 [Verrucomicrobia bacterium]|nr:MAG: hypothetical protein DME18_09790 [Verrucomicrobiota bacterium]